MPISVPLCAIGQAEPRKRFLPTMRIAKPLLLVLTPIGVAVGLVEGYRLAGGLVVLMAAMLLIVGLAAATVVLTVRRERRQQPGAPPNTNSSSDPTDSD